MPESPGNMFRFGVFEFDASARELRREGRRLKLSGQPVEVLAVFLENAGRIVSREELRKRLWPENTFVDFDHSLNTAINKLREVLGDSASEPRFIETLPRRGYRFIASVESEASAATAVSTPPEAPFAAEAPHLQTKPKLRPPWAWMAAFLALVGAVLGLRSAGPPSSSRGGLSPARSPQTPRNSALRQRPYRRTAFTSPSRMSAASICAVWKRVKPTRSPCRMRAALSGSHGFRTAVACWR
jgi:DNA-binding winged helix-turn-helix (wHTH) protein